MSSDRIVESRLTFGAIIDGIDSKAAVNEGVLCEKLGFDSIWFTDHLLDNGGVKIDPWTTMAAIAPQTSRVKMGTAVTDTLRIQPAKTANIVATLNQISKGRSVLGIGAGEAMNLVPFGLPFEKPSERVRRLEEAIKVIRLLWKSSRQNPVSFSGQFYNLQNAWLDLEIEASIPIYVGAIGGKHALTTLGKFSDGWISWINSPTSFHERLEIIKSVAKEVGRDPSEIRAFAWVYATLTEDQIEIRNAINRAKRTLLLESQILRSHGWKTPEHFAPYQNMLVTDEGDRKVVELQESIQDNLAIDCIAAGSRSYVIERIEKYRAAGATDIIIVLPQEEKAFRQFSQQVMPYFN